MISEVYNMDCLDGMRKYPDNHFDLAIVDPPYGIDAPNMQMGANKSKNKSNTSDSVANKLKKARFSQGSGKLKDRKLNTMKLDWDIKPDHEYFKELFRVSKNQVIWGGGIILLITCILQDVLQFGIKTSLGTILVKRNLLGLLLMLQQN